MVLESGFGEKFDEELRKPNPHGRKESSQWRSYGGVSVWFGVLDGEGAAA